jgi:N-acetylglucosaminyldiphosphoundecaprenol N-acetyl-beta-D-mannosaminyltransferase
MKTVEIAGINLTSTTKLEVLREISSRIKNREKTSVITPYSEFIVAALRDSYLLELFNKATFSLPDGIGVLWADKFLSLKFSFDSYYLKIIQAFWQMVWTGASIILMPQSLYQTFPEKIVGADFFWDLLKLADEQKFSVYLLGGERNVPVKAAELIKSKFPNLKIKGTSNKIWNDPSIIQDINLVSPDMVFVFFPYRKQERWIMENFSNLDSSFIIGLGGTLDYAVGEKIQPPRIVRQLGLEWLFRLFTQPYRVKRIWDAFVGLITALIRYKVFVSQPFRQNAVVVIISSDGEVLICQRNPQGHAYGSGRDGDHQFVDYWQFPQGGVDFLEELVDAARREAFEEVGLKNLELIQIHENAFSYLWRNAVRNLIANPLKFKGQMQSIVYFQFTGNPNDVVIDNHEFISYDWIKLSELPNRLHSERQSLADIVIKDLKG